MKPLMNTNMRDLLKKQGAILGKDSDDDDEEDATNKPI